MVHKCAAEKLSRFKDRNNCTHSARLTASFFLFLVSSIFSAGCNASQVQSFDLSAGNLIDRLEQFCAITGLQLVYDPKLVVGEKAPAVVGRLDGVVALNQLLKGSRLHAEALNPTTFILKRTPTVAKSGDSTTSSSWPALAKITVHGVIEQETEGLSVLGVPMPVREIPQSVSVISQQSVQQQNLFDLDSALRQATGITLQQIDSVGSAFYARGFQLTAFHVDGGAPFILNGLDRLASPDLAIYDSVEILRGADGLFGGNGSPGATLNLVRKHPLPYGTVDVSATASSYNNLRLEIDATGPLDDSGDLRGRFVAVHEAQDYFYRFASQDKNLLYGIMEYEMSVSTLFTMGASFEQRNAVPSFNGLPTYIDGSQLHLPRSTSLSFPRNRWDFQTPQIFLQLNHRFSEDWTLRADLTHMRQSSVAHVGDAVGIVNPVTNIIDMPPVDQYARIHSDQLAFDAILSGTFDFFGKQHELMFGIDRENFSNLYFSEIYALSGPPVNVYHFDPTLYAWPTATTDYYEMDLQSLHQDHFGAFVAVRFHPWSALSIIVGASESETRVSGTVMSKMTEPASMGSGSLDAEQAKFTPYAGIVYTANDWISWYASYADISNAQPGELRANMTLVPPAEGVNLETGIKSEWFGGTLNASVALFRTHLLDASFTDPYHVGPSGANCCFMTGTSSSRGIEAELSGHLTSSWDLTASYTYNENHYGDAYASYGLAGQPLVTQAPRNLLKVWANYQFENGLRGWSVGGGLLAQTSTYASGYACKTLDTLGNCLTAYVPFNVAQGFYAVASLRVGYRFDPRWQISVNINNLFDRVYFQTIGTTQSGNWYGDPRNMSINLRGSF